MALEPSNLNDMDRQILSYLAEEGRASPALFMRACEIETSRQWVSSRFVRLREHGHIEDLHSTGIYELRDDPRNRKD